jgi:restriction system protein
MSAPVLTLSADRRYVGLVSGTGGIMARRRGFFAELQYQAALAEREKQRQQVAALRESAKQAREAERRRLAAHRARETAARADAKARAAAEREAKRLHLEAQESEVEARNSQLTSLLNDIDTVLSWTLGFDDHVDLEKLRREAEHPEFSSPHEKPIPAPAPITAPPEPTFTEPPAPSGLVLFGKKKHAAAVAEARAVFETKHAKWQAQAAEVPMKQLAAMQAHQAAEAERQAKLAADRATYDAQCQERQAAVDAQNAQLDQLIAKHAAGDQTGVEEYFAIVFSNSVYPDGVEVEVDHSFHPEEKELEVTLTVPDPASFPTVRAYKYVKAKDEITETSQTQKEQRDRYNAFVHGVVLRTLHEVWESDRLGHVATIALTASTTHIDPATGQPVSTPLIAVAADRATFDGIDLAQVTPQETLKHLKAVVSKNPHGLVAIELNRGVRG